MKNRFDMYSSDSDEDNVIEAYSDASSGCREDIIAELYTEQHEDYLDNLSSSYDFLFEDPDGPYRTLFPECYRLDNVQDPDLTEVLNGEEGQEEQELEEEEEEEERITQEEEESIQVTTNQTENQTIKPQLQNVSSVRDSVNSTDDFLLKPSPATRFLDSHPTECILVAVETTVNRQDLLDRHKVDLPNVDFAVGYIAREPTGWAMPLSCDPAVLEIVRQLYPEHRPSTAEDARMFARAKHRTSNGCAASHGKHKTKKIKLNGKIVATMNSEVELSRLIDSIGGLRATVFVALDVEAAVVLQGGIPLPLEIALLPVNGDLSVLHCFIHPGYVQDMVTSYGLSCGTLPAAHFIPFRNATFLRRDYAKLADELKYYITNPQVIFVNKGSVMDVHAIRWVFGAARVADESTVPIPSVSDIRCFDVKTVTAVLSKMNGGAKRTEAPQTSCWYHSGIEEPLKYIINRPLHCAVQDANLIRSELLKYI